MTDHIAGSQPRGNDSSHSAPANEKLNDPASEENPSDTLIVIEKEAAFLVVWAEDPDDWVACFQKRPGFPARDWAEHMARLHGQRRPVSAP